jgi:recombinational DNA repair protein RecR
MKKKGRLKVFTMPHGAIDPLNNIGPDEIYISHLMNRIENSTVPIDEIILATNTMEGRVQQCIFKEK